MVPSTVFTHSLLTDKSYEDVGRVAQSVQRLDTGWTVRGSNPGEGEIFRTCPDRPWGPASLLYNVYRVFPGGKQRPGRDADPSPLLVVKKEQSYTATPLIGLRPVQSLSAFTSVRFIYFILCKEAERAFLNYQQHVYSRSGVRVIFTNRLGLVHGMNAFGRVDSQLHSFIYSAKMEVGQPHVSGCITPL